MPPGNRHDLLAHPLCSLLLLLSLLLSCPVYSSPPPFLPIHGAFLIQLLPGFRPGEVDGRSASAFSPHCAVAFAEGDMAAMPDVEVPNPFVLMPNILDKLKILDYEAEFAREMMNGELLHSVRSLP